MKKTIYLTLSLLIFMIVGCNEDDFLTQRPDDKLTTEYFYRNVNDAEAALSTTYAQIGAANRWDVTEVNFVVEHFRSDLCIPGPDSWNYPDWTALSTFSNTSGNSRVAIYWEDSYRGIFHANQVIEKVENMPDENISSEMRNQIVAEAKFIRGFLHFRLLNNFKEIIVRTKAPTSDAELSQAYVSREEAWQAIEQDFKEAIDGLPVKYDDNNVGRATKGAAIGYLGKAYLYQGKWSEAAGEFKKLVEDRIGDYKLVDNFLSNFDGTNENNSESVFEIQYSAILSNGRHLGHVLGKFTSPSEIGGWGNIEANKKLLELMKSDGKIATTGKYDSRLYQTLFFNDPDVDVFGKSYNDVFGDSDRLIFRKFMLSDRPEAENSPWYSSQNVPQMRYSDVLLMYAEALNESGSTAKAIPFINEVRERSDMPELTFTSKEDVKNAIIHERAVELAYEGHRFFDLRRWGQDVITNSMRNSGKDGAEKFNYDKHAFFPIPDMEVNSNSEIK